MNTLQVKLPEKLMDMPFYNERYVVLYGGRDSGKSHAIARTLIIKAYTEKCNILCCREIQTSIKDSVHSLLALVIKDFGLSKAFEVTKDEIRCITTGSKFIFKGLRHNIEDVKGKEDIKYCWVSEARTISEESWNILIPTIRKEGSQFFIDLNPDQEDDPVYQRFILTDRPDVKKIKVCYYDNPFLSDTSKQEIDYLQRTSPDLFKWIYGGEIRETTEATILHNIVVHDFDYIDGKVLHTGADWGFNHATTIMQSFISDNELYVYREYYKTGLDPDELRNEFLNIEWIKGRDVFADSARPELIKLMNATNQLKFHAVRKSLAGNSDGKKYNFGMALYLKQFKKIHIHKTNCPYAAREFKKWSWQVTKEGKILDVPLDLEDDTVDSVKYSLENNASRWFQTNMKGKFK